MKRAGLFSLLLASCSSSTAGTDASTDAPHETGAADAGADVAVDAPPPKPRAAIASSFGDGGTGCNEMLFSLGTLPDGLVEHGAAASGTTASVSCTVKQSGQKFDVLLHAELDGKPTGLDLMGMLTASGSQSVDIIMLRTLGGMPINKMMCTGVFGPGGIAPGRVWLKVSCPKTMDPPLDGCPVEIEARFENCAN